MFLLGGPPFSGKTLLAHLLNQGQLVCLDEPDFHDPHQSHRWVPLLQQRFPNRRFPEAPAHPLTYAQAVDLIRECQEVIRPHRLGIKTAGRASLAYAEIYKRHGYPTVAIVRDVRDVLAEAPLPPWIQGESELTRSFRLFWRHSKLFDLWLRYEDLVSDPEGVIHCMSRLLSCELKVLSRWHADSVARPMLKLERHNMLTAGRILTTQVGIWKRADRKVSWGSWLTAKLMGY